MTIMELQNDAIIILKNEVSSSDSEADFKETFIKILCVDIGFAR